MNEARVSSDLVVGSEIDGPVRVITQERIEWYDSAMLSAAKGELARVGSNIHTDEEYAKSEGLAGIIADGMISANWISSMLVEHFGMAYLEGGELRTKFIKPILLGTKVSVRAKVLSTEQLDTGAVVYSLGVWCEDDDKTKLTVGDAKIEVVNS
jgi:3-hydroxybutyryl-CoA dehydratase